jgi:hypothetical protein
LCDDDGKSGQPRYHGRQFRRDPCARTRLKSGATPDSLHSANTRSLAPPGITKAGLNAIIIAVGSAVEAGG